MGSFGDWTDPDRVAFVKALNKKIDNLTLEVQKDMEEQWMSAEYRAMHMHAELHSDYVDGCDRCKWRAEPSVGELEDMFGITREDWLQWEAGLDEEV
jgi:hemerythrin